jgi:hypothetical protein
MGRIEIDLAKLVGRTVVAVERVVSDGEEDYPGAEEDYVVLRFDDGSTLYADQPTAYGDDGAED